MKLLFNGPILTMSGDSATVAALAYDPETGLVVAAGDEAATRAAARQAAGGRQLEEIDLRGRGLLPGFIDAHHHLCLNLLYGVAVDCSPAKVSDAQDVVDRLAARARETAPGQWVVGKQYDEWRLAGRAHPTREHLDAACPDHPALLMHYSFHEGVANSRALAALGLDRHTPDPVGGRILHDPRGRLTGRLLETAVSVVEGRAQASMLDQDREGYAARLDRYQRQLFAAGITRLADPAVSPTFERLYRELRDQGRLRIPLVMMPVGEGGFLVSPSDRLDSGDRTGAGPEELRIGSLKLFFDGGAQCAVALSPSQVARVATSSLWTALSTFSLAPFQASGRLSLRLGRDLRVHTGVLLYADDASATRMVQQATDRGWAVAIHSVGNEATARAVTALAAARDQHPQAPPPRVEHATLLDAALIERLAEARITVVAQPHFISIFEGEGIPPTPGLSRVALRSMLQAGVPVAGSSDSPVTPFEPLLGIRSAVTRRVGAGPPVDPEEAIDAEQALALYTRSAARACGCLDSCGTLEVGKRADLVILSADPRTSDAGELDALKVEQTVLGGETVFQSLRRIGPR